jgi:hypothetical protein
VGVDLIRESVWMIMQQLIDAEATEGIGAGRYERSEVRVTERNGARERLLATRAGDVELRIPELRKGSFIPVILEPRRRIDQAVYAVIMEAYVYGVSPRSVDDLVAALASTRESRRPRSPGSAAGLDIPYSCEATLGARHLNRRQQHDYQGRRRCRRGNRARGRQQLLTLDSRERRPSGTAIKIEARASAETERMQRT